MLDVSILKNKVMDSVVNKNNEELIFTVEDGEVYRLYHEQNCCEHVSIDDICGDLNDLVGLPLLISEDISSTSEQLPPNGDPEFPPDSFTWTFYRFATRKGFVTVKWYGESNGYYSERVDFERVVPEMTWEERYT